MSPHEDPNPLDAIAIGAELKLHICKLVDGLVQQDEERYEADFVHFLTRARDLIERKRKMEGTKSDTRDLIGELLFNRLRRSMRSFLGTTEARDELKAAQWTMGALFSISTMSEFAQAFDQALIKNSHTSDFSFAGRTDFISVEEVMQMLAAGKHLGCLALEKADNRLDVYLKDGRIVFLDPHNMIRRVLPTTDPMRYHEIPEAAVAAAQSERSNGGRPVVLALHAAGQFKKDDLRELMRSFGKEVLFDFMRETQAYSFFYRRLDALPEFADQNDLRLGVTAVLLEGSKKCDDWKQMLRVFPDPNLPVEPRADMFKRMSDAALTVLELKLVAAINGELSPRGLTQLLGLPLHDVYQMLVRLAREGIVAPQVEGMLEGVSESVEDSMQQAFAALDANDDKAVRRSALDKLLPDEQAGDVETPAGDANMAVRAASKSAVLSKVFGGDQAGPAGGEPDLLSVLKKRPR